MGVVLEKNKFFLGRKEGNPKLLRGEVEYLFFGRTISFGGGITKVGGLNLMVARIFSWGINNCFINILDIIFIYCFFSCPFFGVVKWI